MTQARSRDLSTATRGRRVVLAAEALTLPYAAGPHGGDRDGGGGRDAGGAHENGSATATDSAGAREDGSATAGDAGAWDVFDLSPLFDAADAAVDRLQAVPAARIHPDGLGDALKRLRRVRNRLEAVETAWITQLRDRKVHRSDGARSATSWVAEQLGGSKRDAGDQLRTGDRLAGLPETAGAFADGHITRQAASAIATAMDDRRLRDMNDAEDRLLAAARDGGADQVRRVARELKAAADVQAAEADAADRRARRYAAVHRRSDGMVKVDALLDQDNGEPFITVFNALFNPARDNHHSDRDGGHDGGADRKADGNTDSRGRTWRQRGADTLGEMARRLLAVDDLPDVAGQPATVLVTIPEAVLYGRLDDGPARMAITGPVPPSTARRLACDAQLVPVVLDGTSVPIDIGRASREPTAAQRRCLAVRDRQCRMCGATDRLLSAHHCIHWADGGPTDLRNLILLCRACHRLCHEGRWSARWQADNTVVFIHPDGRRLVRPPPT